MTPVRTPVGKPWPPKTIERPMVRWRRAPCAVAAIAAPPVTEPPLAKRHGQVQSVILVLTAVIDVNLCAVGDRAGDFAGRDERQP